MKTKAKDSGPKPQPNLSTRFQPGNPGGGRPPSNLRARRQAGELLDGIENAIRDVLHEQNKLPASQRDPRVIAQMSVLAMKLDQQMSGKGDSGAPIAPFVREFIELMVKLSAKTHWALDVLSLKMAEVCPKCSKIPVKQGWEVEEADACEDAKEETGNEEDDGVPR